MADPPSPGATNGEKHKNSAPPAEPEKKAVPRPLPFPEKPAVIEEHNGEIEFRVVNNDGGPESLIILTRAEIAHSSMAIVKKPLSVVGGITFRPFKRRKFAEIVFCGL
ncbi:hypothetical protein B0J13DRAFT_630138 [Dactylonectria estremocensis]|uniref:Uncharacterized protein n=1 Tax=Dactylonectria estremocensis TaxID=1079267 RepID=A0A9P9DB85_9HYPO|nr:hypothetical protein B0J13DRAFT_630138 [Dactylonectria estremocensis]